MGDANSASNTLSLRSFGGGLTVQAQLHRKRPSIYCETLLLHKYIFETIETLY